MKKKPVGIVDIAKKLKVSITTVSFIMNGKAEEKRISSKLVDKVMNYVKEVNYTPNYLAKSLRTGKSNLIGLIVENIANPFFANVARLIEESAYKKGFRILYCSSENDIEKTKGLINVFRERQVEAYIIAPTLHTESEIRALLQDNATVVLFDRYFSDLATNYVVVDNFGGTNKAIQHLIDQGYRNIAFVTLISEQIQMQQRLEGYKKAIKNHRLKSFIKKIRFDPDSSNYTKPIQEYLQEKTAVDAVFFATNYLGISGLEAIDNLDKKIPGEMGVISFDDLDLFRLYKPSITVVAQPIERICEKIIEILLAGAESEKKSRVPQQIVLDTEFIIRNSSKKKTMNKLQK